VLALRRALSLWPEHTNLSQNVLHVGFARVNMPTDGQLNNGWAATHAMQTLTLQPVPERPGENDLLLYPDFLIGCLLREGIGRIEADLSLQRDGLVDFILTPRASSTPRVVAQIGTGYFRSVLARFGARLGDDMLYGGHRLFCCDYEREGRVRPHRFSVFICSYQGTAFWLRLYLYGIDGIWPLKEDAV
jgi:hypothetical protein